MVLYHLTIDSGATFNHTKVNESSIYMVCTFIKNVCQQVVNNFRQLFNNHVNKSWQYDNKQFGEGGMSTT